MKKHGWILFLSCIAAASGAVAAENVRLPLVRAHAHNDYMHERPLQDALSHGFWSVEADVWLTNGVLLVAHDFDKTSPGRTLQKLYLDPLRAFVKTNTFIKTSPPMTLLIDVKSDAEPTWAALDKVLEGYRDIFTRFEGNVIYTNSVIAIISGERAESAMRSARVRFAALDGRLPALDANPPVSLVPIISDNWTKHFKWRGTEPLPEEERVKLRELVRRTHAQGRHLRLWAVPDNPAGWKELRDAGVDLLNTDKLAELEAFFRAQ